MKKYSLFIGRFQPFHLGHFEVIKEIIKKGENLIIGIGSAENSFLPDNPFTASERFQMIKNVLEKEKISSENYCIIPVRNINNYQLWARHVEMLCPPFNKVYTGSKIVKKLFENEKKYEVIEVKKTLKISATMIRKAMIENKNFEKYIHPEVTKFLKEINALDRIKIIF